MEFCFYLEKKWSGHGWINQIGYYGPDAMWYSTYLVTLWNSYYFELDSEIILLRYVCVYYYLILYHYTIKISIHDIICYCTLRGRIKDKNSTLYAIKCQVCCIENTAWWLKNTVQLH